MCYAGEPINTYDAQGKSMGKEEYVNMGRYSGHKQGTPEWDKQAAINERVVKQMNKKREWIRAGRPRPAPGRKQYQEAPEPGQSRKVKGDSGYQDERQKKKALEVRRTKRGSKEFAPIDEKSMPQGQPGGINVP